MYISYKLKLNKKKNDIRYMVLFPSPRCPKLLGVISPLITLLILGRGSLCKNVMEEYNGHI